MHKVKKIVGVKDLRKNLDEYIDQITKGNSFIVVRRSKPVFNITPVTEDDDWEEVADFTKIKNGGVKITEILSRL